MPPPVLASESSQQTTSNLKKRGRKLTEAEKYQKDSEEKIEALRQDLKKKGLTVAARQKIRNMISAQ